MKRLHLFFILIFLFVCPFLHSVTLNGKRVIKTDVIIKIPQYSVSVDSMIYGQMLEDCNDKVIYGGIVNEDGSDRPFVTQMLKPLNIPIVRWPGGTYSHEYHWEDGVGPLDKRPVVNCYCWGGADNHKFGTDEFLEWCKEMKTTPYLNLNMGNQKPYGGTLEEALNWIEYVNGTKETVYGKKRADNGHLDSYNVEYWCVGNENYGSWGRHNKETSNVYSLKLNKWAGVIKKTYPDLKLLAVGFTCAWDDTVLMKNGHLIDYLTQHYYVNTKVKNGKIENPQNTTFAPVLAEAHLRKVIEIVQKYNDSLKRIDHPIKLSIDEWNNRHLVWNAETDKYEMKRGDDRYMTDVVAIAGMLNVFIRNSPTIAMANYLFPVNGHGLVKTIGETDAYEASIYYVFKLYRELMVGKKIDMFISGPRINSKLIDFALDTGLKDDIESIKINPAALNFIDGSAVMTNAGNINLTLINRSSDQVQEIKLYIPKGYKTIKKWELCSQNINDANTPLKRNNVKFRMAEFNSSNNLIKINPCSLVFIQLLLK